MDQVIFVDSLDTIVTKRVEIELAPEAVGLADSDKDQVGRSSHAEQKEDEEEGPDKLHVPVPEVDMPHAKRDEQDPHNQTAEAEAH